MRALPCTTQNCDCGLPARGEAECNACFAPPTGTNGCCCATFFGDAVPRSDCSGGVQVCADTDLVCCGNLHSGDGVCNEAADAECLCPDGQRGDPNGVASCMECDNFHLPPSPDARCVATAATTGQLPRGWDSDCGGGYGEEECMTSCTTNGECEVMRDEDGNCEACPMVLLGFLTIFLFVGWALASCAIVNDKLTGDVFKLHAEQVSSAVAHSDEHSSLGNQESSLGNQDSSLEN